MKYVTSDGRRFNCKADLPPGVEYDVELTDAEFARVNRDYDDFLQISRETYSGGLEERHG